MERLVILVATHFIGDFPFQSDWMARYKGVDFTVTVRDASGAEHVVCAAKWYEVLFYHVATYVSAMYVFMRLCGYHPTPQGVLVDGATHLVIDRLKARDLFGVRVIKPIWLDQLCHLTVRVTLWHLGWL